MPKPLLLSTGVLPWALLLAACTGANPHDISATFACDGGKKIQALFITGAEPAVKLTLSDGRQLTLPQALAASGARYANTDESVVFWNKGRTAFLEEAGHQSYSGCEQRE